MKRFHPCLALFAVGLAGCGAPGQAVDFVAANTVSAPVRDAVPEAAAEAHAELSNLPARISDGKRIEVAHRPGGTGFSPSEIEAALRDNAGFWPYLREAVGREAVPARLDQTGGAAVRDFMPIGLLAAWQYRKDPGPESLSRLVDAYEAAVRLAESGALVHAQCGKEIVVGIGAVEDLPPASAWANDAELRRLEALVERAPSPADVLDNERVNRLLRFAATYEAMATRPPDPADVELSAYFAHPKQPIMEARDRYWRAWVEYARDPGGTPPALPEELGGMFGDATERPEAMERMIHDVGQIRAGGAALLARLRGADPGESPD